MRLTGHYPVSQRTQEAIIPGSLDTKCLISLKKRMSCSSSHITDGHWRRIKNSGIRTRRCISVGCDRVSVVVSKIKNSPVVADRVWVCWPGKALRNVELVEMSHAASDEPSLSLTPSQPKFVMSTRYTSLCCNTFSSRPNTNLMVFSIYYENICIWCFKKISQVYQSM